MKYKSLPTEFKVDEEKREIEAYVSTFDFKDSDGDIVRKGAFSQTVKQDKSRIKVLWQHDIKSPVGLPKHIEEDSKGLYTVSKISKTTLGNDLIILANDGVISETSIGFNTLKDKWNKGENARELLQLKLWEYSFVTWGANSQALVSGVKTLDDVWNHLDVVYELQKEVKAGRVLSEKNRQLLKTAIEAMQAVINAAEPQTQDEPDNLPNEDEQKQLKSIVDEMKAYAKSMQ
ncbi:HK97 family phage prohead protease [Bacillus tianshenii]|nr:HK97 family phage prohead protease [Bacillus tianshenii]